MRAHIRCPSNWFYLCHRSKHYRLDRINLHHLIASADSRNVNCLYTLHSFKWAFCGTCDMRDTVTLHISIQQRELAAMLLDTITTNALWLETIDILWPQELRHIAITIIFKVYEVQYSVCHVNAAEQLACVSHNIMAKLLFTINSISICVDIHIDCISSVRQCVMSQMYR